MTTVEKQGSPYDRLLALVGAGQKAHERLAALVTEADREAEAGTPRADWFTVLDKINQVVGQEFNVAFYHVSQASTEMPAGTQVGRLLQRTPGQPTTRAFPSDGWPDDEQILAIRDAAAEVRALAGEAGTYAAELLAARQGMGATGPEIERLTAVAGSVMPIGRTLLEAVILQARLLDAVRRVPAYS